MVGLQGVHLDDSVIDVILRFPRVVAVVEAHPVNEVLVLAATLAFLQDLVHLELRVIGFGRVHSLVVDVIHEAITNTIWGRDPLVVTRCPAVEVHLHLPAVALASRLHYFHIQPFATAVESSAFPSDIRPHHLDLSPRHKLRLHCKVVAELDRGVQNGCANVYTWSRDVF